MDRAMDNKTKIKIKCETKQYLLFAVSNLIYTMVVLRKITI